MYGREIMVQKEKTPRVAVCLAAYNGMSYIDEQINSILAQKNVHVSVFISVDNSTDGTEDHLALLARAEPRLKLLPFGQRFGGAGPNFYRLLRDVDLNGFEYLSFADQDDVWHPDKLWRAHCVMQEVGAVGYSSNFTAFWPSGARRLVDKAFPQRSLDFLFESAGPGCTYVLQLKLAKLIQEFIRNGNSNLVQVDYHDWLVYAFARFHSLPWVIDGWSSMMYRQHSNNQIGVNSGWKPFWLRVRKILDGYGFAQSLLIAKTIEASALPAVQRGLLGGRLGYLRLALSARECRRKPKDQFLFLVSCVLLAIRKPAGNGKT